MATVSICAFPHILGSPSSYITLQLLHSEFPYICARICAISTTEILVHPCLVKCLPFQRRNSIKTMGIH
jgi:hypothetical protein